MTTKQDVWLAVYRDALKEQRRENPSLNEEEWSNDARNEADRAAEAFATKFPAAAPGAECDCEECRMGNPHLCLNAVKP